LNTATFALKLSRNEQCAVIIALWAKILNANQIHSAMHPVYGDECFAKPTVQVWHKKMLGGQKFTIDTKVQSVVRQWLGQQRASFFALGIQKLVDR